MSWRAAAAVVALAAASSLAVLAQAQADARAIAAAGPYYSVVDLGCCSSPSAVNEAGLIVGSATDVPPLLFDAVRWSAGGQRTVLATLGGATSSATAINSAGEIAGWSQTSSGSRRATLWTNGQPTDLGSLGADSAATGINDDGDVVGTYQTAPGGLGDTRGFLWRDGVMADIGTLGGPHIYASDINSRGDVVGASYVGYVGPSHVFLKPANAAMIDLGDGEGVHAVNGVYAVNDRRQIVGSVYGGGFPYGDFHAALWEKGVMKDLGALGSPESTSHAYGIDAVGKVVGTFRLGGTLDFRAVTWQRGPWSMIDLNVLIAPGSGWRLTSADAISDSGRIVGVGYKGDAEHAFLLVPLVHLTAFAVTPGTIPGSRTAQGRVTLNRPAPPGGATVSLASTFADPNPPALVPQTVTVPAGSSSRTFPIPTLAVKKRFTGRITASYNGESRTATLTVRPIGVSRVFLSPNPADRGATVTGTVVLEARAALGPIAVSLTSSRPSLASLPLSTITVGGPTRSNPAGSASRTFTLQVNPHPGLGDEATITASANGVAASATLRVKP